VALVEVDAVHDPLDRLIERGVLEDYVRRLAAKLQGQPLAAARERALDELADLGRAGERHLLDAWMRNQQRPGLAGTGDDVDDPSGKLRLLADLSEQQGGQRGRFSGLEHNGVARGQCRRDLPGQHQQGEVPRDHLARHSQRARSPVRERPLELVGPARVIEEVGSAQRDVDVP